MYPYLKTFNVDIVYTSSACPTCGITLAPPHWQRWYCWTCSEVPHYTHHYLTIQAFSLTDAWRVLHQLHPTLATLPQVEIHIIQTH